MAEFNVGDIVYIKDDYVERFKVYSAAAKQTVLTSRQDWAVQFGLAKDISFTIIKQKLMNNYLTNFTDSWGSYQNGAGKGTPWEGKRYKTWVLHLDNLEKRELNTISLHELNRGL